MVKYRMRKGQIKILEKLYSDIQNLLFESQMTEYLTPSGRNLANGI